MIKTVRYLILSACAACILQSCSSEKTLPSFRETYSYKDRLPFGAYAAYHLLANSYPDRQPIISKTAFSENYSWDYDSSSLYVNISSRFFVNEADANSLLDFVYRGNTAFISSSAIDTILLKKIYCTQNIPFSINLFSLNPYQNTSVRLIEAINPVKDSFNFFYLPMQNSFPEVNGAYARIAGYNENGEANFFVFLWGKGRFYFHAEPRALSNYFLLTKSNAEYFSKILSVLPAEPESIYWDDYYSKRNYRSTTDKSFSSFSAIMKQPALASAFWIALGLLLIYILFNIKRSQRIVPVIKKPENTSVAFAEAIAGVYLADKDNKLIAEKMITYFNEFLRTKYFLSGDNRNAAYGDALSKKSGVPADTVQSLLQLINNVSSSAQVSDAEILTLNGLIEKFYKNKV